MPTCKFCGHELGRFDNKDSCLKIKVCKARVNREFDREETKHFETTMSKLSIALLNARGRPISEQVDVVRRHFRNQGTPYKGTRVVFKDGETEVFEPRDPHMGEALANLDKLPTEAFKVFVNMNGEIAIQQLTKLPHFVLV